MLSASLFVLQSQSSPIVPIRGWMIHGASPAYQELVLKKAVEYGINHLEISGDNPTFSDEMAGPGGLQVARTAERCKALGIMPLIWVRELNTRKKDQAMDPSTPEGAGFWQKRKDALQAAFDRAPALGGIVMSYGSTPTEIWEVADKSAFWQSKTMAQRIQFVTNQFLEVAQKNGKKVYVRDFNHSPKQLKWLVEGLKDFKGLTMHSKWVPQDWQLFYPHSFAVGAYGSTPQVIEADLGAEYWGRSMVPVSLAKYIKHRWSYDLAKGCSGIVARIDRDDEAALGTPSELNIYALSEYLKNPAADPDVLTSRFAEKRYHAAQGSRENAALVRIYNRTFEWAKLMYFTKGFWTPKDQTVFPESVAGIEGTIRGKSTALWDPKAKPLEQKLMKPDAGICREILAEKDKALALARQNLAEFGAIAPRMSAADAQDWTARLSLAVRFSEVWRTMADAVWSLRVAEAQGVKAPGVIGAIKAKAEAFGQSAQGLRGAGPGEGVRQGMAARALLLAEDIIRRADRLASN